MIYVVGNFWSTAFQGKRVVGVPWLNAELRQHPDPIGELQRLVQHVLTLHITLGDGVHIAVLQLGGNGIGIEVTFLNLELQLVLIRDVLPRC